MLFFTISVMFMSVVSGQAAETILYAKFLNFKIKLKMCTKKA